MELTKSTFDSAVMDPAKHALVYFYAPWCIHCQKLDQDFEKLGKVFEKKSSVVVAKVGLTGLAALNLSCHLSPPPPMEQGTAHLVAYVVSR